MRRLQRVCCVAVLLLLCSPCQAGEGSTVLGVPDEESVARATKLIRTTFAQEYASAVNLDLRAALARRLLKEALETRDDAVARYALLCETREMAAKSADAATACRAIDELVRLYGVAPGEMTLAALSAAARVALTVPNQETLARSAMAAADAALLRDEYDLAGRLAALADATAQRTKRIVLITDAQDKVKEITWATQEYHSARAAIERLTTSPDDARAKSAAGRFKCLVKNDWEHGLPLLREGTDAEYKALAEKDLAALTAPAGAQRETGDVWWDLGEKHLGRARLCCRSRAAYWYQRCVDKLTGLPKTVIEKRLEELEIARLHEMHMDPGLLGEYFAGEKFEKQIDQRVDGRLDLEWKDRTAAGLPKDAFSVRWTGYLRVPVGGKYSLGILVNEGARVYVDEKVVVEEAKGSNKRKPTSATVALSEGLHPIKVEYWDGGGQAKMKLFWAVPGKGAAEEIVPAKAFVHSK
jgi:hypothetical protein